ncbi:MAG: PGRS repeat-containing protein, partial [Mycobacterium sp.]
MRNYVYPCATGIAVAGAGAVFALAGSGTALAAPIAAAPLAPVSSQCDPSVESCTTLGSSSTMTLTPFALAAALDCPCDPVHSWAVGDPFYNLIGVFNYVPIVNIFVSNGANGALGSGVNGGNGGLWIGYGGTGGSGAAGQVGGNGGQGGLFFGNGGDGGAGGTSAAGGNGGNAGTIALFGHGGNGGAG